MVAYIALGASWFALGLASWALFLAARGGWARQARILREEQDDRIAGVRRELVALRDEWEAYADKLSKRYRNAARTLNELERRQQESVAGPEPEDVRPDDAGPLPNGRLPTVPAHLVASGAFGAGRSG